MLPAIKLRGHLHRSNGQIASALTIISIDQSHQQGIEFEAFCLKLNEEYAEKNVAQLTIIETGYLKRHYQRLDAKFSSIEKADVSAIALGEDWVNQQQSSLDKLTLPFKIMSWKEVLETKNGETDQSFSFYLSRIESDYVTDKVFRNHVDKISKKYAEKLASKYNPEGDAEKNQACLKAAKAYLLEESSIIFKLVHHGFTSLLYPGSGNAALRYVHRKYFGESNPMPWLRYDIQYPKHEKQTQLKNSKSIFFQESAVDDNLKDKNYIKKLFDELPERERLSLLQELTQASKTNGADYGNS